MAEAWSTVVTREPEWDDYARAEAMAEYEAHRMTCRNCGLSESMRPIRKLDRYVNWGDGSRVHVKAYRCLSCMATALVERDQGNAEKDHKTPAGLFAPGDGRRFVATKIERR